MKSKIDIQKLAIATFNQIKKLNIDPLTIINIPLSRKPKNDLWTGICSELGLEFDFNVILNIKAKWTFDRKFKSYNNFNSIFSKKLKTLDLLQSDRKTILTNQVDLIEADPSKSSLSLKILVPLMVWNR